MPKFVVLRHDVPGKPPHWDFMLESSDALRTWALELEPAPDLEIRAKALDDHRLAYLTYEGPISGDRGSVSQWDSGHFIWIADSTAEPTVRLHGRKLQGTATLRPDAEDAQRWIFRLSR